MNNVQLGRIGEDAAVKILQSKGYEILERNYRCKSGEIDIIALRNSEISFIEVKTRQSYRYGRPCEAVGYRKQQRIRTTALHYLNEMRNKGVFYRNMTFDVMEIVAEHMKRVF